MNCGASHSILVYCSTFVCQSQMYEMHGGGRLSTEVKYNFV